MTVQSLKSVVLEHSSVTFHGSLAPHHSIYRSNLSCLPGALKLARHSRGKLQVRNILTKPEWENAYQYEIPVLAHVKDDGSEVLQLTGSLCCRKVLWEHLEFSESDETVSDHFRSLSRRRFPDSLPDSVPIK